MILLRYKFAQLYQSTIISYSWRQLSTSQILVFYAQLSFSAHQLYLVTTDYLTVSMLCSCCTSYFVDFRVVLKCLVVFQNTLSNSSREKLSERCACMWQCGFSVRLHNLSDSVTWRVDICTLSCEQQHHAVLKHMNICSTGAHYGVLLT